MTERAGRLTGAVGYSATNLTGEGLMYDADKGSGEPRGDHWLLMRPQFEDAGSNIT